MNFHHSTHWEGLCALLDGGLLSPASFSVKDIENPQLRILHKHGFKCVWFSTQAWQDNLFGPYILKYDEGDLAQPLLLELDDHNNARCFLSAPSLLTIWLGARLGITPAPYSPSVWRRADKSDCVDLLVGWQVPMATDLYVTSAKTGRGVEDDANFARARLLAQMLLSQSHQFDAALTCDFGALEAATNLLSQAAGNFASATASSSTPQTTAPGAIVNEVLQRIASADKAGARTKARELGGSILVADGLAPLINAQFGTAFSGAQIDAGR